MAMPSMNARLIIMISLGVGLLVLFIVVLSVSLEPQTTLHPTCPASYKAQPPVILVSLDGFRASYKERGLTPVMHRLAAEGIIVPYMRSAYPTVTFPNHYTIVTGMYPESHGIIDNKFYDPDFNDTFSLSDPVSKEGRWWGGEPMWNTLTRQGKISATYFWPGSDADINGTYPTYWRLYNQSVPFEDRVVQVLKWVMLPAEDRPAWITLYFNEPDHTGHANGPYSREVNDQLVRMDGLIDQLVTGLTSAGLLHCVNLILVSDHGMASGGAGWIIKLEDYIPDIEETATYFTGVVTRIGPIVPENSTSNLEIKEEMMRNLSCKRPDMRQYDKRGLPTRFHYSNNKRIEDIVLDFDPGRYGTVHSDWANLGNHGYDNYYESMHALFIARGPAFKAGLVAQPFQNIELYNLMCYLTGVDPAPNNGTWGSLNHLLVNPAQVNDLPAEDEPPVAAYPDAATVQLRLSVSGCDDDLKAPEDWLQALNLSPEDQTGAKAEHLPWGVPHSANLSADLLLLYHSDHITAYSQLLKTPLWTSFTSTVAPYATAATGKWSSDVRLNLTNSAKCSDYKTFDMMPLFPPEFSTDESLARVPYVVSNAIPGTTQLRARWEYLMGDLLPRWLGFGQLNIITGPVYDVNSDSIVDDFVDTKLTPKVPSDWYAIVTRCHSGGNLTTCSHSLLQTIAFLYPMEEYAENCLDNSTYALKFSSTVKDVATITGLTFYPLLNTANRTRLDTAVHSELW